MHPGSDFELHKLAPASGAAHSGSLAGEFLLLIGLLTFLSTYVQSLEL